MDSYIQIIVTIIGVLGSASIWKYMEARLKSKSESKKIELQNNDGVQYRDDLKNRVRNLEAMLASSSDEKEELRKQVLELVAEVNTLRVKVEFLEKENERLKNK
jgi:predicted nuclease with TOPRIM domain